MSRPRKLQLRTGISTGRLACLAMGVAIPVVWVREVLLRSHRYPPSSSYWFTWLPLFALATPMLVLAFRRYTLVRTGAGRVWVERTFGSVRELGPGPFGVWLFRHKSTSVNISGESTQTVPVADSRADALQKEIIAWLGEASDAAPTSLAAELHKRVRFRPDGRLLAFSIAVGSLMALVTHLLWLGVFG